MVEWSGRDEVKQRLLGAEHSELKLRGDRSKLSDEGSSRRTGTGVECHGQGGAWLGKAGQGGVQWDWAEWGRARWGWVGWGGAGLGKVGWDGARKKKNKA